jgi:hypothetical protein
MNKLDVPFEYIHKVILYLWLYDIPFTIKFIDYLLLTDHKNIDLLMQKAYALESIGKKKESFEIVNYIIRRLDSAEVSAHIQKADLLYKFKKYNRAIKEYRLSQGIFVKLLESKNRGIDRSEYEYPIQECQEKIDRIKQRHHLTEKKKFPKEEKISRKISSILKEAKEAGLLDLPESALSVLNQLDSRDKPKKIKDRRSRSKVRKRSAR